VESEAAALQQPSAAGRWDRCCRPTLFLPLLLGLGALASLWFAEYRLPSADEGGLLTNAVKLLRGGVFYRDVDAYPFPLATYLLAGWMALFGEHLSVSRGLATLFYLLTLTALYVSALELLGPRRAAGFALSLLSLKLLAWPSFTAYAYWDVSFALGCAAVALLLGHRFEGKLLRPAAAGVLVGLALLAKQSLGIYLAGGAGAALLFAGPVLAVERRSTREAIREAAALALGVAVPLAAAAAYFASEGLLGAMLESGLIRPFTGYLPSSGIPFSPPLLWWRFGELRDHAASAYFAHTPWALLFFGRLPGAAWYPAFWAAAEALFRAVYTSVPVAFIAAAAVGLSAWRAGALARERGTLLLAILGGSVFLSAFPRADYAHVIGVYPLVLLLLFALWGRLAHGERSKRALAGLEAASVGVLLAVCSVLALIDHGDLDYRVRLERADVWVRSEDAWIESLARFVEREVPPDEPIFVYSQQAELYFLTGRQFDWPFSQLYPGQTGDHGGAELLARVRSVRPMLVIRGLLSWPGLPILSEYVPLLNDWVDAECERVPEVFEADPPPAGAPEWWVVSVLRPCDPARACRRFGEFMRSAPAPWKP
jgi:hypothetical protein